MFYINNHHRQQTFIYDKVIHNYAISITYETDEQQILNECFLLLHRAFWYM